MFLPFSDMIWCILFVNCCWGNSVILSLGNYGMGTLFFNDLNWLERKILLILLSILFWVLEFLDVWQILNKQSLWFGVSGSDQSHHHQTLRERWWNQAWLCIRTQICRHGGPRAFADWLLWHAGQKGRYLGADALQGLSMLRLWASRGLFYIILALGSNQVGMLKTELWN